MLSFLVEYVMGHVYLYLPFSSPIRLIEGCDIHEINVISVRLSAEVHA